MSLDIELAAKQELLRKLLGSFRSLLVAYSGGTDSAFLAWAAHQVLGDRMLAVIADSPSLSSRIEYGRPVTTQALTAVEQGEDALRALGFSQCRVRHHGEIVRIEIAREEMARAHTPEMAAEFSRIFHSLGFKFVTLDLDGFRSGSMNALLPLDQLRKTGS